ncbi:MAG: EAL domain-containing protein [Epsilonproteobacteria bacterium]|nr:EAL domain-containing protein [Campylobacterota bacterium]
MPHEKRYKSFHNIETLDFIVDSIDALIYVIDLEEKRILYSNLKAKEAFGTIDGKVCYEVLQEQKEQVCDFCSLAQKDFPLQVGATYKWENYNPITQKTYLFSDQIIRWYDGTLVKVQIGIDISKQKQLENEMMQQRDDALDSFEALTNATIEGLIILDEDKRCIFVNAVAPKLFGYSAEEMIGKPATYFVAKESQALVKSYIQKRDKDPYESLLIRKDGSKFPALLRGKDIMLGGKKVRISAVMDISTMKEKEQEISKLAYYDPLTALPNRTMLVDRLNQLIHKSIRDLSYGALMFIDLDNFKTINDTKGHLVGDLILKECAKRISQIIRKYDFVARLGGDEFVILVDTQTPDKGIAISKVKSIASKVLERLRIPFIINQSDFRMSASIGIMMFVDEEYSIDDLMRYADSAMYHSKERERGSFSFFNPELQDKMEKKALLLDKLHKAIEEKKIYLHYQKQIDKDENTIGLEALARWQDDELGFVSPSEFIPLAEESGLIVKLGEFVLSEAVHHIKSWEEDAEKKNWHISINVSLKQFESYSFEDVIKQVLQRSEIAPHKLKLEITESLFLHNIDQAIEKISHLKNLGVSLSIDDFGTGYSSLSYLKKLPIDELKIDRSFIQDILQDKNDETIVLAILDLGKKFGFNVTAEGVESEEVQQKLLQMGCEYFQGYYFGRPVHISKL